MVARPLRQGGETRAASDSLRQRQALPAALVSLFTPLARRTIPQATTGAGGISASQGQEGAETCIVIPNIGFISNVLR